MLTVDSHSPMAFDGDSPLHVAVRRGRIEDVRKILIQQKVNVNFLNYNCETPLHLACSQRDSAIIQLLIAFGADPYIKDSNDNTAYDSGNFDIDVLILNLLFCCDFWISNPTLSDTDTPLHNAVRLGKLDSVQGIIQEKIVDINIANASYETPLHLACALGRKHIVHTLISNGADVYIRDCYNNAPIHRAVSQGHMDILDYLITDCTCDPNIRGYQGRTLLHFACATGNVHLVNTLIDKHGISPLTTDAVNQTPLHIAASHGQEKVVRLLVTKYNCPVDCRNRDMFPPLHLASYCGHIPVVKMLVVEFKANVNEEYDALCPFFMAVAGGNIELVQIMITDFNQDTLSADDSGNTPLHIACFSGHQELVRLLITKYNCPVDVRNKNKETPLHTACSSGHYSVVKMLVSELKAARSLRGVDKATAVSMAAKAGHMEIVRTLISDTELGCSPKIRGYDGRSLLHEACCNGSVELTDMLIADFGLNILSCDNKRNTPLHMACHYGHIGLVRLLITKYNCPVDVKNKNKQTPLHIACFCGHLDVSEIIINQYMRGDNHFNTYCNALDKDGNSPLGLAIKRGDAKAVHILSTEYGCKPHIEGVKSTPLLHQLAAGGFTTMLQELILNFNHDPASVDEDGNTLLHTAAEHGLYGIVKILTAKCSYRCPVDCRNSRGQTALHCACLGGHSRVAKLLITNKADITLRDEDGDTALKKAFLTGHTVTLFEIFDSNYYMINSKLLYEVCKRGSADMVDVLLSDFNLDPLSVLDDQGNKVLHIAAIYNHKEIIVLLLTKYKCPVDSRNFCGQTALHLLCSQTPTESIGALTRLFITEFKADVISKDKNGQTPLHLICSQTPTENVHALIKIFITDIKADVTSRDKNGDEPIHIAAQAGSTSTIINLIKDHGCSPNSRGFKQWTLLHHALALGHISTAKTLIGVFHLSLHCTDEDGNTPLHLSSLYGQPESIKVLLYDYHAPVYVRNKAGRIALDLARDDSVKKMIREYIKSKHKSIQLEYEELRIKSLQKYAGQQIITRVYVLGNSGSGKSTLVESLKRKGISYFFTVTEEDVAPHTAGIVPSIHQSRDVGRLLYYDFAGDKEYYSSHAAILEMVSSSTIGNNIYLIVADLRKDGMTLCNEVGYWLSFISYHGKALDDKYRLKTIIILSHSDCLNLADCTNTVKSIKQYLHSHEQKCSEKLYDIVEVISSNCQLPRSSKSIENVLQKISEDIPPYSISYEASLLHGMLEKDFCNVVACKFQDLLSNIQDTGICLPTVADALYPVVKELHDIGLLMMIGRNEDRFEDYLLLLDLSSLTHEVHQKLFSHSARQKFSSSVSPYYANMGILPERYLTSILPEHITKDCLIQLQYCQEFSHAEVGLNYLVTPDDALNDHLLYFPALCKLESEQSDWVTDPKLTFSIGWYTKCTGKFDYFPARFLHVILLRLAFAFALPIANEVSAHNRRCTMWKNGIRWLMEEGVECIFEVVSDNKGIVIITKSEEHSTEWAIILSKIIDKVMQAKAEFCDRVSLQHFLLNSNDTFSFVYEDKLFAIDDVERVIREGKKKVISISGQAFLDSSHLCVLKKYTYWGQYFPISMPKVLSYIKAVIQEWELLGIALQIPYEILREIDADKAHVASKKEEMLAKWMDSPGPACWWLLIKALEEIDQNVAAAAIQTEQGEAIEIQRKLIEGGNQKPDDAFLQSFARVVGDRWFSLASLLSITAREIEEIKREKKEQQALCMLTKWSTKEEATFKQLHQKLQTVYLFRC